MSELEVTVREFTAETVRAIYALEVAPEQRGFVTPNAISIAEAHVEPKAWSRAVSAGDEPVGFAMLYEHHDGAEFSLWRLIVAAEHQGNGCGKRALDLLERVRGLPRATEFRDFSLRYGFEETVEVEVGENVIRLGL